MGPKCPDISNMYFLTMFNNSVVKHFIIADLYSISSGQEGILSYPCPLAGGDSVRGDFVPSLKRKKLWMKVTPQLSLSHACDRSTPHPVRYRLSIPYNAAYRAYAPG